MADLDDSEVFRSSDLQENPDQVALKFLRGGYSRLVQTTAILTQKSDSMEVMLTELQKTISQLSNQLGKRPIAGESSHHNSPVTHSDTYVRDDLNRLPMDNRKSLLRKIEMPKFDGSNAYDWLSKVERFFRVGRYSDFDKLDLVALSLEGDVLKWFNWEMTRREFHSWEEFRQRLFSRFGAAPEESPGNRLFAIKQTGTISAYVTQFEELSAQVVGLSDSHLEQIFYNGLKTEMKEVLKLKDPIGLENQKTAVLRMETSSFCHMLSDKPAKPGGNQRSFTSKPVTTYAQPKPLLLQSGENQNTNQGAIVPATKPPAIQPRQRHTAEELDAMRSKGICFKCKGKYTRGHELLKHPFLMGKHKESASTDLGSVMKNAGTPPSLQLNNTKSSPDSTCDDVGDMCNLGSLNYSLVCPMKSVQNNNLWQQNDNGGDQDNMCLIDDENFLTLDGEMRPTLENISDLKKSCDAISDMSISLKSKFEESPGNGEKETTMRMECDQPSYSEDDYELTESKIKAFFDEKAANLNKLQTPLYEEYYNSLISGQSVALSEIEKKWKEELDQELERKRQEIMRQAGLGSSPRDRGLSRQREKSKVCISGKMTYTKNLLVFLARLLRRR